MQNEAALMIMLIVSGVVSLIAAIYDIRNRRVRYVYPLAILLVGTVCSATAGVLNIFIESTAIGTIITYLLWRIGAIGGGDAKLMTALFAVLRTINPHAGETMVYITFVTALIHVYISKKSVLKDRIIYELQQEITRKTVVRIVKLFLILSSMMIPMMFMSKAYWTYITSVLVMGSVIWLTYELFGRLGEIMLIFTGAVAIIIELINGAYIYLVTTATIAITLVLIRIPIILAFPDADPEKIPVYNPFFTRKIAKIRSTMPLGLEILAGYAVGATLAAISII